MVNHPERMASESARLAALCTACGACARACPMPEWLPLPAAAAAPERAALGMRAILRGEEPTEEGLAWVAACVRSGCCTSACPEQLDAAFMLRLAHQRIRGALGEPPRMAVRDDPGWASRVKAFARMTMSEEEVKRWT
jgi:heterodisulfide reductase subunit C